MLKDLEYAVLLHLKEGTIKTRDIIAEFDMMDSPWTHAVNHEICNYYAALYILSKFFNPKMVLEIGTGFGISTATFLKACGNPELILTLDLGIYGEQLNFENNINYARRKITSWCRKNGIDENRIYFFQVNTQPEGKSDNQNSPAPHVPYFKEVKELMNILEENREKFDILFIDGKHTEDGLLNDAENFFHYLKPGGIMICDDLHPESYKGMFEWAGDTWNSFFTFLKRHLFEVKEYDVWGIAKVFASIPQAMIRPWGLAIKKEKDETYGKKSERRGIHVFFSPDAISINKARLEHLESIGIEIEGKRVLDLGARVGILGKFFEDKGCKVISVEVRDENIYTMKAFYPHRKVYKIDLEKQVDEIKKLGKFDIVFCYGTLYHISNPEELIRAMSSVCDGVLLLETVVHPSEEEKVYFENENMSVSNQAFHGTGSRPSRKWVMNTLRKYFEHVYISSYQPRHIDFTIRWDNPELKERLFQVKLHRAIFVASNYPINSPGLQRDIPMIQERLKQKPEKIIISSFCDSGFISEALKKMQNIYIMKREIDESTYQNIRYELDNIFMYDSHDEIYSILKNLKDKYGMFNRVTVYVNERTEENFFQILDFIRENSINAIVECIDRDLKEKILPRGFKFCGLARNQQNYFIVYIKKDER